MNTITDEQLQELYRKRFKKKTRKFYMKNYKKSSPCGCFSLTVFYHINCIKEKRRKIYGSLLFGTIYR